MPHQSGQEDPEGDQQIGVLERSMVVQASNRYGLCSQYGVGCELERIGQPQLFQKGLEASRSIRVAVEEACVEPHAESDGVRAVQRVIGQDPTMWSSAPNQTSTQSVESETDDRCGINARRSPRHWLGRATTTSSTYSQRVSP